jgi:nitroreductase
VVRDAALIEAAGGQEQAGAVPEVLVFCANPARIAPKYRQRGERLYSVQDATIVCAFAMLAAAALSLATVWVGAFEDDALRAALELPKGWLPVAMLPVGTRPKPLPCRLAGLSAISSTRSDRVCGPPPPFRQGRAPGRPLAG